MKKLIAVATMTMCWLTPCAFANPPRRVQSLKEILDFYERERARVLTFAGFSGAGYQHPEEVEAIVRREILQALAALAPGETLYVQAGNSAVGIGMVYRVAKAIATETGDTRLRIPTSGIISDQIESDGPVTDFPGVDVPFMVPDKRWGGYSAGTVELSPTSVAMVNTSWRFVAIGGNDVTGHEYLAALARGIESRFYSAEQNHQLLIEKARKAGRPEPVNFRGDAELMIKPTIELLAEELHQSWRADLGSDEAARKTFDYDGRTYRYGQLDYRDLPEPLKERNRETARLILDDIAARFHRTTIISRVMRYWAERSWASGSQAVVQNRERCAKLVDRALELSRALTTKQRHIVQLKRQIHELYVKQLRESGSDHLTSVNGVQYDLTRADLEDLPVELQIVNYETARVAIELIEERRAAGASFDEGFIEQAAAALHRVYLTYRKGEGEGKPYEALSPAQKQLNRDVVRMGMALLDAPSGACARMAGY